MESRNSKRQRSCGSRRRKSDHLPRRSHEDKYRHRSYHSPSRSSSITSDDSAGHMECEIGERIAQSYTMKKLLGKGTFGKVFLCVEGGSAVAVKVIRNIKRYVESAEIEAQILEKVNSHQLQTSSDCCMKMFSHFHFNGHYVIVCEPLGISLYDLISKSEYCGISFSGVRDIAKQLLEAMVFFKSMNLIHTDLKLENVMLQNLHDVPKVARDRHGRRCSLPLASPKIKLIDFGGATFDDDKSKTSIINTRQYRGPEVTLELGWSFPSDIWSVACIVAEIYGGDLFFATHEDLEHLALVERCSGRFPLHMLRASPVRWDYFNKRNIVRREDLSRSSWDYVMSRDSIGQHFSRDRDSGIIELMYGMLEIDPTVRMTGAQALGMPVFATSHKNITTMNADK